MPKIVLISCNIVDDPYPVYPLGMSMIAEAARNAGHDVAEIDLMFNNLSVESVVNEAAKNNPDFIGISIRNIDNTDSVNPVLFVNIYKDLVARLKKISSAPVILGGAGYSLFPERLLQETSADYGIAGEGEKLFPLLIKNLMEKNPPGEKVLRNSEPIEGSLIPVSERDESLAAYYLHEGGMLNVQTKRGCPHKCIYCSYPSLEGKTYRFRPPEKVVDEIEILLKKYKVDYYSITDSVFNDAKGYYLKIAEELVKRRINTPWMAFFKPQNFKDEEAELLKAAGLGSVEWGTDASSDTTLKTMRKDFNWELVVKSTDMFNKYQIPNSHFIIFGVPGETEATVNEGLENIEMLKNTVVFVYSGIRIFPGTEIEKIALAEGIIKENEDLLEPKFYFSRDVSKEYINDAIIKSFSDRIDRIYPPGKDIDKIKAFHRMGYRGPVWDLILAKERKRQRGKISNG